MLNEKLYNFIPMFPTQLNPEDIIGAEMLSDFRKHYLSVYKTQTEEEFKKNISHFSPELRETIGKIYTVLLENGYSPAGINQRGEIRWSITADSRYDAKGWKNLDNRLYSKEDVLSAIKKCKTDLFHDF